MKQPPRQLVVNVWMVKLTLLERFVLMFVQMERIEGPLAIILYKSAFGRLYIFQKIDKVYEKKPAPFDGGMNQPWMN